jgi:hypothetical protein
MKYRIYRNLRRSCFSIQEKIPGKGWRVTDRAENLEAHGITFRVYEAGRRKVIERRRKNVHAYAIAESWQRVDALSVIDSECMIYYNPYQSSNFKINNVTIERAKSIVLTGGKLFLVEE